MLRLALKLLSRDMKTRRGRVLLTCIGVSCGVAVVFGTLIIRDSMRITRHENTAALLGDALFAAPSSGGSLPETLTDALLDVQGVKGATGAVLRTSQLEYGQQKVRVELLGLDFLAGGLKSLRDTTELVFQEDELIFINALDSLALPISFMDKHNLQLGQKVHLVTSVGVREMVLRGTFKPKTPGQTQGVRVPMALMDLGAAQVLMDRKGLVDLIAVDTALPGDVLAARLETRGIKALTITQANELDAMANRTLETFFASLLAIALFSVFLSTILVYNTMSHRVLSLRRELSILRCLGVEPWGIAKLVLCEGLFLGAVGIVAGLALGGVLANTSLRLVEQVVSSIYMEVHAHIVVPTFGSLALSLALGITCVVLGSLLPAIEASRTEAVLQAREGYAPSWSSQKAILVALCGWVGWAVWMVPWEGRPAAVARILVIFIIALASLPLLLVGTREFLRRLVQWGKCHSFAIRMAIANLGRDTGRAATCSGAIAVSIAVVIAISITLQSFVDSIEFWVHRDVSADIHVTSTSPLQGPLITPLTGELGAALASVPGVRYVNPFRIIRIPYADTLIQVIAYEFQRYGEIFDFHALEGEIARCQDRLVAGGAVLVTEPLWRKQAIRAGDRITLATPQGHVAFEVCGAVANFGSEFGGVWLHRPTFIELWNDTLVDTYDLFLEQGAEVRRVQKEIEARYAATYDLHVLTKTEFENMVIGTLKSSFYVSYAAAVVAAIIAFLHLTVSFLSFASDRRREMSIMRALGAEERGVVASFTLEAAMITGWGCLVGCAAGIMLGWEATHHIIRTVQGFSLVFSVDGILVAALIVLTMVGSHAAAYHAAARLSVQSQPIDLAAEAG